MCETCGCSSTDAVTIRDPATGNHVHHDHVHHEATRTVALDLPILEANDRIAAANRAWLAGRGVLAINLMSSPGAGKTSLLERTVADLAGGFEFRVLEGDQATENDARRLRAAGARAIQVNTGTGCHLDASMIERALPLLDPPAGSLLMIENVGNLVCPSLFDLGEGARVVVASPPEGDDKPEKYPHMFHAVDLVVLNKVDLLPHVPFDLEAFRASLARVHPSVPLLELSAWTGRGLDGWYDWLRARAGAQGSSRRARKKPM